MEKKQELVSVIITTYRNETYLPRAIESILHQTYPEIELIVVDDNPPDSEARRKTEKVMEKYPQAVYLRHPENRNGAAARNTGIRAARGKYIAFLDNDDFYFSSHIGDCVKAMEQNPDCGCVLTGVVKIREGLCWDLILPPKGDLVQKLLFSETMLGTGSNLFVRTEIVQRLDGFDESFQRHQDVEFGLRLFSICKGCCLNQVQIVKEMEGFSNAPDFQRFLETKRHLWNKFQQTLHSLSAEEQNRYYAGQYRALLYTACKGGNRRNIRWTVEQLKQYRPLNRTEKLLLLLSRWHLFEIYEKLKKVVKRRKSGGLYQTVTEHLNNYDLQMFKEALSGDTMRKDPT